MSFNKLTYYIHSFEGVVSLSVVLADCHATFLITFQSMHFITELLNLNLGMLNFVHTWFHFSSYCFLFFLDTQQPRGFKRTNFSRASLLWVLVLSCRCINLLTG